MSLNLNSTFYLYIHDDVVKENASKKEAIKPEYVFIVKDDKDPRNNVQMRRDVLEAKQKKKNEE